MLKFFLFFVILTIINNAYCDDVNDLLPQYHKDLKDSIIILDTVVDNLIKMSFYVRKTKDEPNHPLFHPLTIYSQIITKMGVNLKILADTAELMKRLDKALSNNTVDWFKMEDTARIAYLSSLMIEKGEDTKFCRDIIMNSRISKIDDDD